MSRTPLFIAVVALSGCFTPADPALFDAFAKGRDVSDYLITQELEETPGGNAILGQSGVAVDAPRVSASVRIGTTPRSVPTLTGTTLSETSALASVLPTADASVTTAHVDLAVPAFAGFRMGTTRVLSFQLLASATLSGNYQTNDLAASRGSASRFGLGARFGLLSETRTLPAVAYSAVQRTMPGFTWEERGVPSSQGHAATIRMYDFSGQVTSHRIAASKAFGVFGATAGWGRDDLDAYYTLSATMTGSPSHSEAHEESSRGHRSVLFAGGSYALHPDIAVAVEVSRTSRSAPQFQTNSVGDAGDRKRTAVMVGVRVGG